MEKLSRRCVGCTWIEITTHFLVCFLKTVNSILTFSQYSVFIHLAINSLVIWNYFVQWSSSRLFILYLWTKNTKTKLAIKSWTATKCFTKEITIMQPYTFVASNLKLPVWRPNASHFYYYFPSAFPQTLPWEFGHENQKLFSLPIY